MNAKAIKVIKKYAYVSGMNLKIAIAKFRALPWYEKHKVLETMRTSVRLAGGNNGRNR